MTLKNAKTVLFGTAILTTMLIVTGMNTSFASHSNGYWENPNQNYYCTYELDAKLDVTTNVDACDDLSDSAGHWNRISGSDFTLIESTYSSTTINIWTQSYSRMIGAITYNSGNEPNVEGDVYIKINENLDYGDVSAGDRDIVDYESITTHEFGHVAGLAHNSNSQSVMYYSINMDMDRSNPNWHDRQELRGLY